GQEGPIRTSGLGLTQSSPLPGTERSSTLASSKPFRSLRLASTSRLRLAAISDWARRISPEGRISIREVSLARSEPAGSTTYHPCPASEPEVMLKETSLLGSYWVNSLLASIRRPWKLPRSGGR